jgi:hypothetical protein
MLLTIVVLSVWLLGGLIYILVLDRSYRKTMAEARRIYHDSIEEIKKDYKESLNKMNERYEKG